MTTKSPAGVPARAFRLLLSATPLMNAIYCHLFPIPRVRTAQRFESLLEPPAPAIRHDRDRVMLGLFDAKRDGF